MKKLLFGCLFISFFAKGQQDSLNDALVKSNSYFRFVYENDLFCHTDRYYTQGVAAELVSSFIQKSPLSKTLVRLNKKGQNYYGLHLEQDCFTPVSIQFDTINRLERPYTGTFALGHFLISLDPEKKRRLFTKIDVGLIGSCAECEEEQKAIHRATNNAPPLGWKNQMSNDLLLDYSAEYETSLFGTKYIECIGAGFARAGTIYDDIGAGMHLRIGRMNPYFISYGISKNVPGKKLQMFLTAKANYKLVAYNGTLQGGLFSNNVYEMSGKNISHGVFVAYMSFTFCWNRLRLEYATTYLSKEFNTGLDHGWGRCDITLCF